MKLHTSRTPSIPTWEPAVQENTHDHPGPDEPGKIFADLENTTDKADKPGLFTRLENARDEPGEMPVDVLQPLNAAEMVTALAAWIIFNQQSCCHVVHV